LISKAGKVSPRTGRSCWVALGATFVLACSAHCEALESEPSNSPADHPKAMSDAGGPPVMRRLNQEQYAQTVADVFGPDIAVGFRTEPEIREAGLLAVGSSHSSFAPSSLEQFDRAAHAVAIQVTDEAHWDSLVGCAVRGSAVDEMCLKQFIARVGRLLYRRPLTDAELQTQLSLAAEATRVLGDGRSGVRASLASMLTAPELLFRRDAAEPDLKRQGAQVLDSYSRATRLSFLLWDRTPDETLLEAAQSGVLDKPAGWKFQVDRLLASGHVETGVRAFFRDMLEFDRFARLAKDPALYPKFTSTVMADVQEQTLRTIVDELITRGGDYRDLFTTRQTFLTRRLGGLYELPVVSPQGWERFEFGGKDPRGAGILTHASFVALHSHPGRSSPTLRGRALREIFLCKQVPNPPGNVDFNIVQDTSNPLYKTMRQRLKAHASQPMCAGCHKLTDPTGLALENFDTAGEYRQQENGAPIDASGQLDGMNFDGAQGLGKAVHDDPAAPMCLVNRLYSFAVGREPTEAEHAWLAKEVEPEFARMGYRLIPLLRFMVMSPNFIAVTEPAVSTTTAHNEAPK